MDEQLRAFLATIWGEAAGCSHDTWKAIASVILNRVGRREWRKLKTPLRVIACSGFDAFTQTNKPFLQAYEYFGGNRAEMKMRLEDLEAEVRPLYEAFLQNPEKSPRTTDAVLYYSPKAQASLHQAKPAAYPERPRWAFDQLEEVFIPGTERDDFRWFRYRLAAPVQAVA